MMITLPDVALYFTIVVAKMVSTLFSKEASMIEEVSGIGRVKVQPTTTNPIKLYICNNFMPVIKRIRYKTTIVPTKLLIASFLPYFL